LNAYAQVADLIGDNRARRNTRDVPAGGGKWRARGTLDRHPAFPADMILRPWARMETIPSGDCFVVEL